MRETSHTHTRTRIGAQSVMARIESKLHFVSRFDFKRHGVAIVSVAGTARQPIPSA